MRAAWYTTALCALLRTGAHRAIAGDGIRAGRTAYARRHCICSKIHELGFYQAGPLQRPAVVDARLVEAKRASLVFEQEIRRQADAGELLCKTQVRVACLEADAFKATAIPDYLLQRIKDEF